MKRLTLILCLLALAAFGLAACGDDDDDEGTSAETTSEETTEEAATGGGGGAIQISAAADGTLAYEQSEVSAPAGEITIEFDNPASVPHDVVVEDADGNEVLATDEIMSDQTTASGQVEAGDYTFYCSVPGHREAGMEGTLTAE